MYSKLVEESTRKNYLEEIKVFNPAKEGEMWTCPFCDPEASTVYTLSIPSEKNKTRLEYVKKLIRDHVELHRKDIQSQITDKTDAQMDKARVESMKRVRLWITGTIKDRKLYEQDPL